MTAKKIQPTNPDTTTKKNDTDRSIERTNQAARLGKGRKLARKTSAFRLGKG